MLRVLALVCLFLCLHIIPALAQPSPFQLIYRQDNVVSDGSTTKSNVMINVINRSGGDAKDLAVSVSVPNPYLNIDMPVFIGTIPAGKQAEILQKAELPNILIAASEPDEKIVWRIEYTNDSGQRTAVEIKGEHGI